MAHAVRESLICITATESVTCIIKTAIAKQKLPPVWLQQKVQTA